MKALRYIAGALVLLLLASCRRSGSGAGSGPLTPAQIADRARPATVAIVAEFEVVGDVPQMEPDTASLARLLSQHNYTSRAEAMEGVFSAFLSRPGDYLREGATTRFKKSICSLGTGFIVTPDGYILTNAHVVQPEDEDLKKAAVESIQELVDQDVKHVQSLIQTELPGDTIGEQSVARLRDAVGTFYAHRADIHFNRQISAVMPSAQGESADQLTIKTCELKQIGKPTPGKDVAVLKIEGTDLPTLPLAPASDDEGTRVGSELLVFGYPGKVALDTAFTLQSRMQPSLTIGHVSGTKQMAEGWNVIQTDASVNPGNSGGPAMNDRGQVEGLATFGFVESQGLNFAVSIDVARQFLDDINVKPRQSAFTQKYNLALAQYDEPGHGDALRLFNQLHAAHPESGPVTNFVRKLSAGQEMADQEHPDREVESTHESHRRSGPPLLLFLVLGGGVIGLLILIVSSGRR